MEILNDYAKEQADELTTDEIIENIESMRILHKINIIHVLLTLRII